MAGKLALRLEYEIFLSIPAKLSHRLCANLSHQFTKATDTHPNKIEPRALNSRLAHWRVILLKRNMPRLIEYSTLYQHF